MKSDEIKDVLGTLNKWKDKLMIQEKSRDEFYDFFSEAILDFVRENIEENTSIIPESTKKKYAERLAETNKNDPLEHLVLLFKIYLEHEIMVMRGKVIVRMEKEGFRKLKK